MSLHQLRTGLLQALDQVENLSRTYDHVPGRLSVPAAIITPGLPYLAAGDTYGTFQVRHMVSLVAKASPNDAVTKATDDLVEDSIVALVNAGHAVLEVSPGYVYETNQAQFLAVDITVITEHRI